MEDIRYTTLEKTAGRLNASDVKALAAGIRGEVSTPRDGSPPSLLFRRCPSVSGQPPGGGGESLP